MTSGPADDETSLYNKSYQRTCLTSQPIKSQVYQNQESEFIQSLSQDPVSADIQQEDTAPIQINRNVRSNLKRNEREANSNEEEAQISLSQPSKGTDKKLIRHNAKAYTQDSKFQISLNQPSSSKKRVDQTSLERGSLLKHQAQCGPLTQSVSNSSRNKRDKAQNVNYSLFFQDFDNLSEYEETKKKRDFKKTDKEVKQARKPQQKADPAQAPLKIADGLQTIEQDGNLQYGQIYFLAKKGWRGKGELSQGKRQNGKEQKTENKCKVSIYQPISIVESEGNDYNQFKIQSKKRKPLNNKSQNAVNQDNIGRPRDKKYSFMGDSSYCDNPSIMINIPLMIKEQTQNHQDANLSLVNLQNDNKENPESSAQNAQALEESQAQQEDEKVFLLSHPAPAHMIHLSENDLFAKNELQNLRGEPSLEQFQNQINRKDNLKIEDSNEGSSSQQFQSSNDSYQNKRDKKKSDKMIAHDRKDTSAGTEQSSNQARDGSSEILQNEESKHNDKTREEEDIAVNTTVEIKEEQINTLTKKVIEEEKEREEYCISGPIFVRGQLIPNPFDKQIRNQGIEFIDFNNSNTENNAYKPAMIQKEQDFNHKTEFHFIHKKQSSCNIKRISGVSYIKKSESKQLNVRDRYEKLAPLVIQGSYNLPSRHQDFKKVEKIEEIVKNLLFSENSHFLCTSFESANEISMKNYLLKPHKRISIAKGIIYVVKQGGFKECWKFIKDKHFFVIHLKYDSQHLATNIPNEDINDKEKIADFVKNSDLCLGILTKRGNASIKSMIKVYLLNPDIMDWMKPDSNSQNDKANTQHSQAQMDQQTEGDFALSQDSKMNHPRPNKSFDVASYINCQGAQISGINTIALMLRFELYVGELKWKSIDIETKTLLNTFMSCCEEFLHPYLLEWNKLRTSVIQGKFKENAQTIFRVLLNSDVKDQGEIELWQNIEDLQIQDDEQTPYILDEQIWKYENNPNEILNQLKNSIPIPVTLINTRDCFVYDLYVKDTRVNLGKGRENSLKKEYFFNLDSIPDNYRAVVGIPKDELIDDVERLRVGVTTYENFYSNEEMNHMEHMIEETEKKSLANAYLPMTAQKTFTGHTLKRTKFFFGFRYMWTRTQILEPLSNVAAGVRADVSQPPVWMKTILEEPLVKAGIVEKDFINSVALNVYHDGSEGLAQHFDDATRFKQPIFTLRLFSDSRLSFGSQFYGFCNGAFTIPLPRGCICVMEEGSYSANGVKHCIRPCDMTGKSSAVILRQMHPNVVEEAVRYDRHVDLPMWMSSLRLEDDAVPYYHQKELECEELEQSQAPGASQNVSGGGYLEPKKRGPKFSVNTLERRLQKAKEKEQKEVKKVIDDMIKRVEFKIKEEKEIISRFMVFKPIPQLAEEAKTKSNKNQDSTITELSSMSASRMPIGSMSRQFDSQDQNFTIIQPQGLASCLVLESLSSNQSSMNLDLASQNHNTAGSSTQAASQMSRRMIAPFIVQRNQR